MNQTGKSNLISETFRVAGISEHSDSLKKLARLNPDWNLSPDEIVACGKAEQKIYRLKFISKPVELQKDADTGALNVIIAGQHIGYVRPEETTRAKEIIKNYDVQNIACGIWGGQYKIVDEFHDTQTQQQGVSVTLRITYEDWAASLDDSLLFEDDQPAKPAKVKETAKPTKKEVASKKKKAKKPIFKRWWFWAIVVLIIIGSVGSDDETTSDAPSVTEGTYFQAIGETTAPVETTVVESVAETTTVTEATVDLNVSVDTAITFIEASMGDNFGNYEISHEDGIITINVWEDGIAIGATLAAAGNVECLDSWNELVDNQVYFCNSIWDLVKTLGLTDTAVVVNLLNDGNLDNVLLSTMNGVVFYNVVTE